MKTITFPRGPVFDAYGKIAPNAILVGYEPDSDNLKQWWLDAELQTLAPNPVQAASDGRIPQIFLGEGKYRIRQFVPASEQAIIPDDMTDFPVGDDWTFVSEWLCEGEEIVVGGVRTAQVDFMFPDEDHAGASVLTEMTHDDADWVLVMNHSRKGDCYPRWFYYVDSVLSYDSGSCVRSDDGGSWVLADNKGDPVDARIFGLSNLNADNTSELSEAAAYAYAQGRKLFVPAGDYPIATSGTIVLQCAVEFGNAVHFIVEAGKTMTLDVRGIYEIPQKESVSFGSSYSCVLDFTNNPVRQTARLSWNANKALLDPFAGQNLVLDVSGNTFGVGVPMELGVVSVESDINIRTLSANSTLTIGVVGSTGGKLSEASGTGLIEVRDFYSSAWGTFDRGALDQPSVTRFIVDADVDLDSLAQGLEWHFGEVVAEGGVISISSGWLSCDKFTILGSLPVFKGDFLVESQTSVPIEAFEVLGADALYGVGFSNYGVADLHGKTIPSNTAIPIVVGEIRDGAFDNSGTIRIVNLITFKNVQFGGRVVYKYGTAGEQDAEGCLFLKGIEFGADRDGAIKFSAKNCEIRQEFLDDDTYNDSISLENCLVKCTFSTAADSAQRFKNSSLHFFRCTFNNQIVAELCNPIWIEQCTSKIASGVALYQIEGSDPLTEYLAQDAHIVDNYPNPVVDDDIYQQWTTPRWPRTEGDIIIKQVTEAESLKLGSITPQNKLSTIHSRFGVYGDGQTEVLADKWNCAAVANAVEASSLDQLSCAAIAAWTSSSSYKNSIWVIFADSYGAGPAVVANVHFKLWYDNR
jgi:hypothetical protein